MSRDLSVSPEDAATLMLVDYLAFKAGEIRRSPSYVISPLRVGVFPLSGDYKDGAINLFPRAEMTMKGYNYSLVAPGYRLNFIPVENPIRMSFEQSNDGTGKFGAVISSFTHDCPDHQWPPCVTRHSDDPTFFTIFWTSWSQIYFAVPSGSQIEYHPNRELWIDRIIEASDELGTNPDGLLKMLRIRKQLALSNSI